MWQPKKMKYRKQFRGRWKRVATKGNTLSFGSYGLRSQDAGWVTDRQLEAARVALARATRKAGKFWIRLFPGKPYTKKPPEVGMGAGKGDVSHYVASVSPGTMLFEIDGLTRSDIETVFKTVSSKLPVRTMLVKKT